MNSIKSTLKNNVENWINWKINHSPKNKNLSLWKKSKPAKPESIMPSLFVQNIKSKKNKSRHYPRLHLSSCLAKMSSSCMDCAKKNVPIKIAEKSANKSKNKEPIKSF